MKHLIFLFKNVTTWGQMLPVFSLIFKHFEISSNPFLAANTNQNEKKFASPSSVCHGLQEKAFQVNQLYNVTWSSVYPFIREPRVRIETNLKLLFRGSFGGEGKLHAG